MKKLVFIFSFFLVLSFALPVFAFPENDFLDNGDGTISDFGYNLMWVKCSEGQSGDDCLGAKGLEEEFTTIICGEEIKGITSATTPNWATAIDYCAGLDFAGFQDWYLPTIQELYSIIDTSTSHPAINTVYFPATVSSSYWSSTTSIASSSDAFVVVFYYGDITRIAKIYTSYVRCVRDIPSMQTTELIQQDGAEFYIDKTLSYGDILITLLLCFFLIFGIFKLVWRFVWEQKI